MKIYRLPQLAETSPKREFVLGREALETDAVYLHYCRLAPRESGREAAPKEGYEEIIHVVKGGLTVRQGKSTFCVSAGDAFHLKEPVHLENQSNEEAVYIAAGGRSAGMNEKTEKAVKAPPGGRAEEVLKTPGDITEKQGKESEEYLITEE